MTVILVDWAFVGQVYWMRWRISSCYTTLYYEVLYKLVTAFRSHMISINGNVLSVMTFRYHALTFDLFLKICPCNWQKYLLVHYGNVHSNREYNGFAYCVEIWNIYLVWIPRLVSSHSINTMRRKQNGHHFADDNIIFNANRSIFIQISTNIVPIEICRHWFR